MQQTLKPPLPRGEPTENTYSQQTVHLNLLS